MASKAGLSAFCFQKNNCLCSNGLALRLRINLIYTSHINSIPVLFKNVIYLILHSRYVILGASIVRVFNNLH